MPYLYITELATLTDFCRKIASSSRWIAIDTEFVRTDTYYPELSLIQIQGEQGDAAIIDPLKIENLTPVWDILSNPEITKVFHSARQDLEVLYQVAGQLPVSIFDTQIAAVFMRHGDLVGLARIIEAELDFQMPKDQTRTNWHQRPLTDQQLEYAIDDVRYLAPLYEKIQRTLSVEQLSVLEQDFQALLNVDLYRIQPETAGDKIKAARHLSPKSKAICYRLAEWRESYAQQHNKPKKWTLSDDALIAIAKRPPKTVQALYKVPNIKPSSVKAFGDQWIEIIDEVFTHPETWPEKTAKPVAPTPQEEVLITLGYALCQQTAIEYGIQLNNIANKQQLLAMIQSPQTDTLSGWRHYLIERPFRQLLQGERSLTVKSSKLML